MKNAINYHGIWLMSGSEAHLLHTSGKMQELAEHMRALEAADKKRRGGL